MTAVSFLPKAYAIPAIDVFRWRRQFHEITKATDESIADWFYRVSNIVDRCQYGLLSETLLTEKFLCGLHVNVFVQFAKETIIDAKQALSIALIIDDSQDVSSQTKQEPNDDDYYQEEVSKLENNDIVVLYSICVECTRKCINDICFFGRKMMKMLQI